jgi:ribosomal protein S25
MGNTTLKILSPIIRDGEKTIERDPELTKLWQTLHNGLQTLEKNLLKAMIFEVWSSEDDPSKRELMENYVFHFTYTHNSNKSQQISNVEWTVESNTHTPSNMKQFTMGKLRAGASILVRSLIRLTETLQPIEKDRILRIKLYYYDQNLQENNLNEQTVHPKGYVDATNESSQFFSDPPIKANLPKVTSAYHSLSIKTAFHKKVTGDNTNDDYLKSAFEEISTEVSSGANQLNTSLDAKSVASNVSNGTLMTAVTKPQRSEVPIESSTHIDAEKGSLATIQEAENILLENAMNLVRTSNACTIGAFATGLSIPSARARSIMKELVEAGYLVACKFNKHRVADVLPVKKVMAKQPAISQGASSILSSTRSSLSDVKGASKASFVTAEEFKASADMLYTTAVAVLLGQFANPDPPDSTHSKQKTTRKQERLAKQQQKVITPSVLASYLDVSEEVATKLLARLETKGVVGPEDARHKRIVVMKGEEAQNKLERARHICEKAGTIIPGEVPSANLLQALHEAGNVPEKGDAIKTDRTVPSKALVGTKRTRVEVQPEHGSEISEPSSSQRKSIWTSALKSTSTADDSLPW